MWKYVTYCHPIWYWSFLCQVTEIWFNQSWPDQSCNQLTEMSLKRGLSAPILAYKPWSLTSAIWYFWPIDSFIKHWQDCSWTLHVEMVLCWNNLLMGLIRKQIIRLKYLRYYNMSSKKFGKGQRALTPSAGFFLIKTSIWAAFSRINSKCIKQRRAR